MGDRGITAISIVTTGGTEPETPAPYGGELELTIIRAAGRLMGRWGVTKTTVGDIAVEAGCSRATVYRAFPGGKHEIMTALGRSELGYFFDAAGAMIDGEADLEDALVLLMSTAAKGLAEHEGFQFMLVHEPGLVLPYLGFSRIDRLYRLVSERIAPHLERFVGDRSGRVVEYAARIVLSYAFQPSPTVDLADPEVTRAVVRRHILPAFTTTHTTIAVPA